MRTDLTSLTAGAAARLFSLISAVVRNARTFHPDGRVFRGTVRPLDPADPALRRAADRLAGAALMRIGMGIMKKGAPAWAARQIPDAPSIATRFYTAAAPGEIRLTRRTGEDLDVLFTAGGDRLWKLIVNLAAGGRWHGLHQFDYFSNDYYADVPYRIDDGAIDVWLRVTTAPAAGTRSGDASSDAKGREQALTHAAADHRVVRIEAQRMGSKHEAFVPFAEIRFEEEVDIDQEALHFDPVAGRGFDPHGVLTALREKVYPASAAVRPHSRAERTARDRESLIARLARYRKERVSRGSSWVRWATAASVVVLLALVVSLAYAGLRFLPNYPIEYLEEDATPAYGSDQDQAHHFKYGSTGGEANLGFPLWIWHAAPLVCTDTLKKVAGDRLAPDFFQRVAAYKTGPSGAPETERMHLSREAYKAFGLIYEAAASDKTRERPLPVGVSKRRNLGLERVFVNCAVCHSSSVRASADAEAQLVLGMPANLFDLHRFEQFYFECTAGERFSKENVIPEIEHLGGHPSLIDRYVLYPLAIWIMRDRVQFLASRLAFFIKQPDWGPGRVDTFSNAKGIFKLPWQQLPDWHVDGRVAPDQIGTADFPSIWLQGPRKVRADGCQMELHWDGNNDTVEERNLSAAFGTGATPPYIDHDAIARIEDWLLTAQPPAFRQYFPIDEQLAARGKPLYDEYCSKCHGASGRDFTGARVGFVTPIDAIKTDRYRLDNYTYELSVVQSMLYAGQYKREASAQASAARSACGKVDPAEAEENSYRFKHFHKTHGYANMPLDGIWLRAPYLHNGSVPTLHDLLQPHEQRPSVFYRGNNLYDPTKVGFASQTASRPDGVKYFRYDTAIPGNGNSGHEGREYGTMLGPEQKSALVEYLKTF